MRRSQTDPRELGFAQVPHQRRGHLHCATDHVLKEGSFGSAAKSTVPPPAPLPAAATLDFLVVHVPVLVGQDRVGVMGETTQAAKAKSA